MEQVIKPYRMQLPLQCFFTEKKTRKNAETKFCGAINYWRIFFFIFAESFGIQTSAKSE
jgi:hypothetical protein